jgi:3',5'-cyclic-AMP phosphodiesterase
LKRIAFITDIHLNEQFPLDNKVNPTKNFETILADIEQRKITEIVFGGDIGDATAHQYFFEQLQKFSINIVLGNHDKFENVKLHFIKNQTHNELYYKTEDENHQYFYLDTSTDTISNTQLNWLKQELNPNKALLLFVHHPIIAIDTPVDKIYPLQNRDDLKLILQNFKNPVTIFCGHYHMNDEQVFENIKQYCTAAMSFQILKNAPKLEIDNKNFGYRILEINDENIHTTLIHFTQ